MFKGLAQIAFDSAEDPQTVHARAAWRAFLEQEFGGCVRGHGEEGKHLLAVVGLFS